MISLNKKHLLFFILFYYINLISLKYFTVTLSIILDSNILNIMTLSNLCLLWFFLFCLYKINKNDFIFFAYNFLAIFCTFTLFMSIIYTIIILTNIGFIRESIATISLESMNIKLILNIEYSTIFKINFIDIWVTHYIKDFNFKPSEKSFIIKMIIDLYFNDFNNKTSWNQLCLLKDITYNLAMFTRKTLQIMPEMDLILELHLQKLTTFYQINHMLKNTIFIIGFCHFSLNFLPIIILTNVLQLKTLSVIKALFESTNLDVTTHMTLQEFEDFCELMIPYLFKEAHPWSIILLNLKEIIKNDY